jgi:hypothetical protein
MVLKINIDCPGCGEVVYCNHEWSVPEEVPCPICGSNSKVLSQGLVQLFNEPTIIKPKEYTPLEDMEDAAPMFGEGVSIPRTRKSRGTKKEE